MTNREKRHWKALGIDPPKTPPTLISVDYELDAEGKVIQPETLEEQIIVQCAVALEFVLHGKVTGHIEVPEGAWDRARVETVKWFVGGSMPLEWDPLDGP